MTVFAQGSTNKFTHCSVSACESSQGSAKNRLFWDFDKDIGYSLIMKTMKNHIFDTLSFKKGNVQ